jgi:hypothetical protein
MMLAAKQAGINIDFFDSFRIYNITQLAKYIPGSIWQFVGRVVVLRERGVTNLAIRDSMLAEHAWVIGSAFCTAIITLGIFSPSFFSKLLHSYEFDFGNVLYFLFFIGLISAIIALAVVRRTYKWLIKMRPGALAITILAGVWGTLGIAFWIVLTPFADGSIAWHYIIGLYSLAYVLGFLVPFAPAGLGIRESILAFGLLPCMGFETALLMAGINRISYFVAEIVVVIPFLRLPSFLNKN